MIQSSVDFLPTIIVLISRRERGKPETSKVLYIQSRILGPYQQWGYSPSKIFASGNVTEDSFVYMQRSLVDEVFLAAERGRATCHPICIVSKPPKFPVFQTISHFHFSLPLLDHSFWYISCLILFEWSSDRLNSSISLLSLTTELESQFILKLWVNWMFRWWNRQWKQF